MLNVEDILKQLRENGIVVLDGYVPLPKLEQMQRCFDQHLTHPQFNTWTGYQQNERWRLLIENLLTLSPAFLYPIQHDDLMHICRDYIGDRFQVTEVRGWKTIRTTRNFHGWHNDAWYDVDRCQEPPPQIKLGVYLTDVDSGEFAYVEQSHRQKLAPGHWNKAQVDEMNLPIRHVTGKAGTAFLFDTSGVHRQNYPVLTSRNVVFYNFHDPAFPIQSLDKEYDRYAPLLLNAAFLKGLTKEHERILGFGDERYFEDGFIPKQRYPALHSLVKAGLFTRLLGQDCQQLFNRVAAKIF
ncbi:phytanoyl-CoA dioxygenase family protein [Vibrio sp. Sgm 5]|uniref:phytanoyl-CoA dioxygenase family protein n=1 Tax=Vibrio sp. Sgm 5 TaxID=2994387 RepID=UPI0022495BA0|nr:phytanoyl-CoA dioxygenase family protein [Vibrio sp. Sgm 5]MCX2792549.1 phytanoyl-CoA dioxygenase family protein [Vibrio sp. Sgm 5]